MVLFTVSSWPLGVCVAVHVYVCIWMDCALSENVFSHTSLVGPFCPHSASGTMIVVRLTVIH